MTPKSYEEWQAFARSIRERAERVFLSIRERAIQVSAARLGPSDGMCFLCAHNWIGQEWMTQDQNAAAREILAIEQQGWEPSRLADRIIKRAWNRMLDNGNVRGYARYAGV